MMKKCDALQHHVQMQEQVQCSSWIRNTSESDDHRNTSRRQIHGMLRSNGRRWPRTPLLKANYINDRVEFAILDTESVLNLEGTMSQVKTMKAQSQKAWCRSQAAVPPVVTSSIHCVRKDVFGCECGSWSWFLSSSWHPYCELLLTPRITAYLLIR